MGRPSNDPDVADDYLANVLMRAGVSEPLRYDHSEERWHILNEVGLWAPDRTDEVYERVRAWAQAAAGDSVTEKYGVALASLSKKRAVLDSLAFRPEVAMTGDEWDQQPALLGCTNGIVDLRLNALVEADPDNPVSRSTEQVFEAVHTMEDFDRVAPNFMRALREWMSGDEEMVAFLLLWFGASLFGFSPEQRFLLLTGSGRNGKGALKHAILKAVGEYGAQFDANLYMRTRQGAASSASARADLMALRGKRITFFSEPEGNHFNEELLKAHTGGDMITARALYSNSVQSWAPTHSITFLVNNAPEVEDVGTSMAARVMVADFREHFDGAKEDRQLYTKLEREAAGILAILCCVAQVWWEAYEAGGGIVLPQRVVEQSEAFMRRSDPVGEFVDEACVLDPSARTSSSILHERFREWWKATRGDEEWLSPQKFVFGLEKRGLRKARTESGRFIVGIRPMNAVERAEAEVESD